MMVDMSQVHKGLEKLANAIEKAAAAKVEAAEIEANAAVEVARINNGIVAP